LDFKDYRLPQDESKLPVVIIGGWVEISNVAETSPVQAQIAHHC
jgi:hypothetical protein